MEKRTPKREVEMKILIDIGHPAHVHLFKNVKIYWLVQMLKVKMEEMERLLIPKEKSNCINTQALIKSKRGVSYGK